MPRAVLFSVGFIVGGAVLFALLAPFLFPNADMGALGMVSLPLIAVAFGVPGFLIGRNRDKKVR